MQIIRAVSVQQLCLKSKVDCNMRLITLTQIEHYLLLLSVFRTAVNLTERSTRDSSVDRSKQSEQFAPTCYFVIKTILAVNCPSQLSAYIVRKNTERSHLFQQIKIINKMIFRRLYPLRSTVVLSTLIV